MNTLLFTDPQARAESRQVFESLPMPARTDEAWRFAPLSALDLAPFAETLSASCPVSAGEKGRLLEASQGLTESAGKMVFANDELVAREVFAETLCQQGVIWLPLDEAAAQYPDLLRRYFMTHGAPLGSQKFAALHSASVKSGTFLYVPQGVEIALPIEVFHWLTGEGKVAFPHTLLVAEAGSKVTLVDYFMGGQPDAAGLAIGVNDLYVGAGAELNYVCVQNWSRQTLAFQVNNTVVGCDACARSLNVNLGGRYARTESASRLTGEGGRSEMLSVTAADGDQQFDQRTFQDHIAPGAFSDLLYKNAIDGKARTIFAGMIRVEPGAHRTDAYQKVRNLLLSEEADSNSLPGLEILADEVSCSHGATAGQIDDDQLFYLRARGIPEAEAQRLIIHGFLQEAIERLGNPAIAARLGELVGAKLGGVL